MPGLLQFREDGGELPSACVDRGVTSFRENSRKIFEQAAAGDVRKSLDAPRLHQRQERADVNSGRFKQDIAQAAVAEALGQIPLVLLCDAPNQAEAIAVDAGAGEAEDDVARCDLSSGQHLVAVD